MPRVSAQYRRVRRDQISRAAIRCIERKGVHEVSIADIVAESGLSIGAIYSHFTNKAELVKYIASDYLIPVLAALADGEAPTGPSTTDDAASPTSGTASPMPQATSSISDTASPTTVVGPRTLLAGLLKIFNSSGLPPKVILQFWAETTIDQDIRHEFSLFIEQIWQNLARRLRPWATERAETDSDAEQLTWRTARTVGTLFQGYVTSTAIFGDPPEPDRFLDEIQAAFS